MTRPMGNRKHIQEESMKGGVSFAIGEDASKGAGHSRPPLFRRSSVHVLIIIVLGLIVYSNTFSGPFQWDDNYSLLKGNPILRDLHYFTDLSRASGFEQYGALKSRYMGFLTFALNYKINGLDVTGYHVVNLSIHIINAILVYFLVLLIMGSPALKGSTLRNNVTLIALFSSLLFVAHPLQIEAVTYIFQRFASLVTLLYLLSLLAYGKARLTGEGSGEGETSRGTKMRLAAWYAVAVFAALLAMKTKENAFTLPVTLVVFDLLFFSGPAKRRVLFLLPFLATMLIIPITLIGINRPVTEVIGLMTDPAALGYHGMTRDTYFFTQLRVIITYLRLLFFPMNQNLDYDYPLHQSFTDPEVLASFFFLLCILAFAFYLNRLAGKGERGLRAVAFGVFWFFITMSVESSVIPIPMTICEYRVYLLSAGFFLSVTTGIFLVSDRLKDRMSGAERAAAGALALIVLMLSTVAYARNDMWTSRIRLWQDTVSKSPRKAQAHNDLGTAYLEGRDPEDAIREFRTAAAIAPDYRDAFYNLGNAYKNVGALSQAAEAYRRVLFFDPSYAEGHNNLGNVYRDEGFLDKALKEYQTAAMLKPELPQPHVNLGIVYLRSGRLAEAEEELKKAILVRPDYAVAHEALGEVFLSLGQRDKAVSEYSIALSLDPSDARLRNRLEELSGGGGIR
jgi:Tfp pilus assembly protein PilF